MLEHLSSPHTHTDSSSKEIYDVIVVGAGPIGLATALGLRRRGIENVLVVDQTRAFRQVGQALDLLPNGLKAFKYLDPITYEEVKKNGMRFFNLQQGHHKNAIETMQEKYQKNSPKWVHKNLQGQQIRAISLEYDDWLKDYGEGRVSIAWYDLQTTLRCLLPEDWVKVNHRCINVVEEPETECVRIDCLFDMGTEANPYAYWADKQKHDETQSLNLDTTPQQLETKSLRAKLVVAADGINSTVRRVLYTDSDYHTFARPEYSGFAAISCREIAEMPDELRAKIEEKFLQESPIATISNETRLADLNCQKGPSMMLFHRQSVQLGYIIHLALPLDLSQGKSGTSLIELAVQELQKAGFPYALKQLVHVSPPDKMEQRPYYIHRATVSDSVKIPPAWSAGRVVLVGDAAHGMPPFMAQGANQGFEDALFIATLIGNIAKTNNWDNRQAIAKAFEKYECLRRPLIAYVQQATLTRFPNLSEKQRHEYNQQVYGRNFDQVMEALLQEI